MKINSLLCFEPAVYSNNPKKSIIDCIKKLSGMDVTSEDDAKNISKTDVTNPILKSIEDSDYKSVSVSGSVIENLMHHKDGDICMMQHAFGNAAKNLLTQPTMAVSSHNQNASFFLGRRVNKQMTYVLAV